MALSNDMVRLLAESGRADAHLLRELPLTREQVRYLLALVDMRSTTRHSDQYGPFSHANATFHVRTLEDALSPDVSHEHPESGLEHLRQFLQEMLRESDEQGLWGYYGPAFSACTPA